MSPPNVTVLTALHLKFILSYGVHCRTSSCIKKASNRPQINSPRHQTLAQKASGLRKTFVTLQTKQHETKQEKVLRLIDGNTPIYLKLLSTESMILLKLYKA